MRYHYLAIFLVFAGFFVASNLNLFGLTGYNSYVHYSAEKLHPFYYTGNLYTQEQLGAFEYQCLQDCSGRSEKYYWIDNPSSVDNIDCYCSSGNNLVLVDYSNK